MKHSLFDKEGAKRIGRQDFGKSVESDGDYARAEWLQVSNTINIPSILNGYQNELANLNGTPSNESNPIKSFHVSLNGK